MRPLKDDAELDFARRKTHSFFTAFSQFSTYAKTHRALLRGGSPLPSRRMKYLGTLKPEVRLTLGIYVTMGGKVDFTF